MGEPAHRRHRPNSELTLAIPVLASTASSDSARAIAFKASARTIAVKSAAVSSATAPPHAFQNDPDRLLGRIMLARRPSDVLNNLLGWFLRWSSLLSHLRSCERYDEPETLPYSIHPVCPMALTAHNLRTTVIVDGGLHQCVL
jgi:hypothetical protein